MKRFPVVVLCGFSILLASCSDKPASTCVGGSKTGMSAEQMSNIDQYFISTDFNKFVGSTVNDLENSFILKYKDRVAVTKPPAQLIGLNYTFPDNNYTIHVYFSELKFTNFNSKTNKWDFKNIKKEKIGGIKVDHIGAGDFYYCKDFGVVTQ